MGATEPRATQSAPYNQADSQENQNQSTDTNQARRSGPGWRRRISMSGCRGTLSRVSLSALTERVIKVHGAAGKSGRSPCVGPATAILAGWE